MAEIVEGEDDVRPVAVELAAAAEAILREWSKGFGTSRGGRRRHSQRLALEKVCCGAEVL